MAFNNKSEVVTGIAYWAKVVGSPMPAYEPGELQWSIDVVPDGKSKDRLSYLGLAHKLKDDVKNSHDGHEFVTFTRREKKRGTETLNKPVRVTYKEGHPEGTLIGNGSQVSVLFNIYDIPSKGRTPPSRGFSILEVNVHKLVEYKKPEPKERRDQVNSGVETWKGDVA